MEDTKSFVDRQCNICGVVKPATEFYSRSVKGKSVETWQHFDSYCKLCRSQYMTKLVQDLKKKAVQYLGGRCVKCGLVDNDACIYDFHHRDPRDKDFSIANKSCKSWEKIKPELDKCDLVCANCHRKIHYAKQV